MRAYHYGERLRFMAKLRAPRNFRNPGAFDYRGYLADHGIAMLASRRARRSKCCRGSSAQKSNVGVNACTGALSARFMRSGARRMQHSWMPQWWGKAPSWRLRRGSTSNGRGRITSSLCRG
jgi:Domain of unknown function (DUF4131)